MKKITWLIIANSVEAQIHKVEGKEAILLDTLSHEKSRLKSINLVSDKPGKYKKGSSSVGSKYSPPTDPHEEEKWLFAKEIADFLEEKRQKKYYDDLIICAEPNFQGLLNKAITEQVQLLIKKYVDKNYIPLPKHELNAAINDMIQLPPG